MRRAIIKTTSTEYLMKKAYTDPAVTPRLIIEKRYALYVLLLLLLSSVTFLTTGIAHADSLTVTAKVQAQIPTAPAIITTPVDQQNFDTQLITVSGTCPPEGAYVIILRNSISSGTAPCVSESFTLPLNLISGMNQLQALVYNRTDDPGPPSTIVTAYYTPPSQPAPSPELPFPLPPFPSSPTQPITPPITIPLTLEYHYVYQVRGIGKEWKWNISLQGGTAPYICSVDWGDGQREILDITAEHTLSIHHIYKSTGTFTPIVTCRDRDGTEAVIQLLAVVDPNATDETGTTTQPGTNQQSNDAIPSYVIVGAPVGAVLVAALVHAFVIQGKLPRLPRLPKKLK